MRTIDELLIDSHKIASDAGWHDPEKTVGEYFALFHSEISEALEEYRNGHGLTETYFNSGSEKPEGIPIELADLVIRVADFCEHYSINLAQAIILKTTYNKTRSHRHGNKVLNRGDIVDIAGGEPFLYPGLIDLLHALAKAGLYWAITTNAKATDAIYRMYHERPKGGICINVSDHTGNPEARQNIERLRNSGYMVNVHRVDHPAAGHHEPDAQIITYQDWQGGNAVDGKVRFCTAGVNHWIAGPNGDLWRCIVAAQTGQPTVGNLFTKAVNPTSADCDFGCSSCYTENPAEWGVEMRELVPNAV